MAVTVRYNSKTVWITIIIISIHRLKLTYRLWPMRDVERINGPVARKAMNLISPLITRDVTAGGRIFFLKNFVRGGTESYGQRNAWRSMWSVWITKATDPNVSFHRIPKDPIMRAKWTDALHLQKENLWSSSRVGRMKLYHILKSTIPVSLARLTTRLFLYVPFSPTSNQFWFLSRMSQMTVMLNLTSNNFQT